jgi:hypothetical protein
MTKTKKPRQAKAETPMKKASGGPGKALTIVIPPETLVALKTKAAQGSSTVRACVLNALRLAGYPVPANELIDRRRK